MTVARELRKRERLARKTDGNRIVVDTVGVDSLSMVLAETTLVEIGLDERGRQTIARWAEQWWRWSDGHYRSVEDEEMRALVWGVLRRVDVEYIDSKTKERRTRKLDPNRHDVSSTIDAMMAVADRVPSSADLPYALPGYDGPSLARIAVVRNGLLDPSAGTLHPATPRLFATAGAAVDFDASATCPTWEAFLGSIFTDEDGTDHETIRLVRQIFGWLIARDTTRHAIPLFIGPPRSGKSTTTNILRAVLGEGNVCAPPLSSLAESRFGLWPLLGKTAAIIPDARLGNRADQAAVAGLLLMVSGRDPVEIDRKGRKPVSIRLGCRILIVSNELPRISDASGALASRFCVVETRATFLGKEDRTLEEKLRNELPGIMRWAIEGWRDLEAHGWVKPARTKELIDELDRLGSPTKAFIADRLVLRSGAETSIDSLYREWETWCSENGRKETGTKSTFARDLRAALPGGVRVSRPRDDGDHSKRKTTYSGLGVRGLA